jgi:hypothetical protein
LVVVITSQTSKGNESKNPATATREFSKLKKAAHRSIRQYLYRMRFSRSMSKWVWPMSMICRYANAEGNRRNHDATSRFVSTSRKHYSKFPHTVFRRHASYGLKRSMGSMRLKAHAFPSPFGCMPRLVRCLRAANNKEKCDAYDAGSRLGVETADLSIADYMESTSSSAAR